MGQERKQFSSILQDGRSIWKRKLRGPEGIRRVVEKRCPGGWASKHKSSEEGFRGELPAAATKTDGNGAHSG